jgi:hypothetical protein
MNVLENEVFDALSLSKRLRDSLQSYEIDPGFKKIISAAADMILNQYSALQQITAPEDVKVSELLMDVEIMVNELLNKLSVINPIIHIFKNEMKFLRAKYGIDDSVERFEQIKF